MASASSLVCSLARLREAPDSFCFQVEALPGRGRCCVATKAIKLGDTLALDPPLLYWEDDEIENTDVARAMQAACEGKVHPNVVNLLASYITADDSTRDRVDDFAVAGSKSEARLIADKTAIWTSLSTQIWQACPAYHHQLRSIDHMVGVLTKSHINAHGFGQGHAMLEIASKSNHACSPNATYVPVQVDGQHYMRLLAIKPIEIGQEILTTYIAGQDMLSSTRRRRALLLRQKAFLCRCSRCIQPDIYGTLPCPACKNGLVIWHDMVEENWVCSQCRRCFWDGQVTTREKQLGLLLTNLDSQMNQGAFPPLNIMAFLLKDVYEDLGPFHPHQCQAWSLLEEVYAYRDVAGLADVQLERPVRLANAWRYIDFLTSKFWQTSPVVSTNLSVLRLQTLNTHGGLLDLDAEAKLPPPGIPFEPFCRAMRRSAAFLEHFLGALDEDAVRFRNTLKDYQCCAASSCRKTLVKSCTTCPRCSLMYCSRLCVLVDRAHHTEYCQQAEQVATLLNDQARLLAAI